MTRLTLLTVACSLMTACAAGPPPMPVQLSEMPRLQVPPAPNLTQPPPVLSQPASGHIKDLEADHREVAKAFHLVASQLCHLLNHLETAPNECAPYLEDPAPALRKRPR